MARLFWHPMTEQPTEPERWNTFVIAYPNPRFYRSKFAGEPEYNGIPPIFSMSPYGPALISPIRRKLNTGHASRPQHIYFEDFAMKIIFEFCAYTITFWLIPYLTLCIF